MEYIKEENNHCILNIDQNKIVESITYTDGTSDLFLDINDELFNLIKEEANKREISIENLIVEALQAMLNEIAKTNKEK